MAYRFRFLAAVLLSIVQFTTQNEVKIVGGSPAYPGEFPYQVSLRTLEYGHICGGAILSPNLIVTAQACTEPRTPPITKIVAGTLAIEEDFPGQQVRVVGHIVNHPGYNTTYMHNDLALIFLDEPFVFNEYIGSIPLPEVNRSTHPARCIMSGWGSDDYNIPLKSFLHKVEVDTYSDADCEIWEQQEVRNEILCSGRNETGYGSCLGDAGTPLVVFNAQPAPYLAAVMSHFPCPTAENCCGRAGPTEQSPELAFYIDWIMEQSQLYGGGL